MSLVSELYMATASVVIPTFNRKTHLRAAIESALRQSVPVEIVVVDDGSQDGTSEMVRNEFPNVIYRRYEDGPRGPSFARNRGTELATSPIVFPIDDDSEFASDQTVAQTLAEFDHPRVGAVAIPFINVRKDPNLVRTKAPDDRRIYVTHAYVGASHALRRDLFLSLGGYREEFFYMGEEGDLCNRMLAAGYFVRLGLADPIHHHESPIRVLSRSTKFTRQNDVLYVAYNVPFPHCIVHAAGTMWNGLRLSASQRGRYALDHLRGIASGYAIAVKRVRTRRKAVPPAVYKLFRRLKREGYLPMTEAVATLNDAGIVKLESNFGDWAS